MTYYLGVDAHKKYSVVAVATEDGTFKTIVRIANTVEEVHKLFTSLENNSTYQVVLEAGRNWGVVYDLFESMPQVEKVLLANPVKVKAIAHAHLKTDTVDAKTLAHLLRVNYIPEVYVPAKEIRVKKYLLRHRTFLVNTSTRIKNRIHILLERNHIPLPSVTDLFGRLGRRFLESVVLPGEESLLLKQHLQLLQYVESLLKDLREVIKDDLFQDERVRLLQTIPGIGEVFAPLIALEIDDINRFKSYRHFWSYCGLVPSIYASGGRIYHGHLIKGCNKWLKWAFIEAVYPATRSSPYLGFYYEKKSRLKGKATAAIATARKLAMFAYWVLRTKKEYQEPQETSHYFSQFH
ncbi:MAG: IS110 family transposase [candidate division WOR-3 bacterium]